MRLDQPIARWQWGVDLLDREIEGCAIVTEICTAHAAVQDVLVRYQLAVGESVTVVRVGSTDGKSRSEVTISFRTNGPLNGSELADRAAGQLEGFCGERAIGSSDTHSWLSGNVDPRDADASTPMAFSLSVSCVAKYLVVTLETYIDVWMPYDLRGRSQPDLFTYNSPRLAAALQRISAVIGSEIDPCERSKLARATEVGVENFFRENGEAEDTWYRYFGYPPG
ncbi:hypothetical protein [Nocardia lijiangensis]|uniref:hypothetical protein n=1 Tax=Nocardia lijiangensis TaxID=299618 RepID=UPI003D75648C